MDELISIIVPVYRVEKYLRKCVDSILSQTYLALEIILVDDGSPDRSPEMCEEYAVRDSRVKVIHQKNAGLSAARNAGLELATGKYIGFVDSDDYIERDMFERLYHAIKESNSQIAVCGIFDVYEEDSSKNDLTQTCGKYEILSREQAVKLLLEDQKLNSFAWNKLYRKDVFREIWYPQGKRFEDMFVTHQLFDLCERIVVIPQKLYYYVRREGSICSTNHTQNSLAIFEAYLERLRFCKEKYPNCTGIFVKKAAELGISLYLTNRKEHNHDIIDNMNLIKAFFRDNMPAILRHKDIRVKYKMFAWIVRFL